MAELVINTSGTYTDYFIVSFAGGPYAIPEKGADLILRLRGRVPSRYDVGGMDAGFGQGADEEGVVVVQRFFPWEDGLGPGGVLRFEGIVSRPNTALHAQGALAFGSLEMPAGIRALLGYEGLAPEHQGELMAMPSPPLGTLRMS